METKTKKKVYTKEFKLQAVERAKAVGNSKTSDELGVSIASLSAWRRMLDPSKADNSKPSYEELQKEVKRLKRELGYVEEINKVLKKSTAIFSNDHFRGSK